MNYLSVVINLLLAIETDSLDPSTHIIMYWKETLEWNNRIFQGSEFDSCKTNKKTPNNKSDKLYHLDFKPKEF